MEARDDKLTEFEQAWALGTHPGCPAPLAWELREERNPEEHTGEKSIQTPCSVLLLALVTSQVTLIQGVSGNATWKRPEGPGQLTPIHTEQGREPGVQMLPCCILSCPPPPGPRTWGKEQTQRRRVKSCPHRPQKTCWGSRALHTGKEEWGKSPARIPGPAGCHVF